MSEESVQGDPIPPGCGLWLGWMGLTFLGTAVGWAAAWRISFAVPGMLSIIALGGVMGLVLGLFQWPVLYGVLRAAWWWIVASVLGWAVGFPLGVFAAQQLGLVEAGFGVVTGTVTGACVGLAQWLVLRRQVTQAGWWLPATIFAWGVGLFYYQPGATWLGLLYGALVGIVTGIVLLWLIYRPVADSSG